MTLAKLFQISRDLIQRKGPDCEPYALTLAVVRRHWDQIEDRCPEADEYRYASWILSYHWGTKYSKAVP